MGVNLIFVDDDNNEYPFFVGFSPSGAFDHTTGETGVDPISDQWDEAIDVLYTNVGEDYAFAGTILTVDYTDPDTPAKIAEFDLWTGHTKDLLRNSKYIYKGYPNAQIGSFVDTSRDLPYDKWYHLKGADPEQCRYMHVYLDANNKRAYRVYKHDKTTPLHTATNLFFASDISGANPQSAGIFKYMITDWSAFRYADSANASRSYVVSVLVYPSQYKVTSISVITGVKYRIRRQINVNAVDPLWWLLQTGYEPEPEPVDDDDPYSGDDSPYDPAAPGGGDGDGDNPYDPGDDIDIPDDPPFSISDTGLLSVYIPDLVNLNLLAAFLWSSNFVASLVKDLYADPMDVIISLGVLPFNITPGGYENIKVGDRDTGISSAVPRDKYITVDCGSINLRSTIGAYIDYAPYTKGDLYIPFVGFVPLDIDAFMKTSIGIKYKVEICTGEAIVFVTRGGKVWQTFSCNLMTPIPLSSANYSQMWQTVIGATAALAGAGAIGAAGMGAAATAGEMAEGAQAISSQSGNAAKASSAIMSASSTKPNIQKSNNVSVLAGIMANRKPFIQLHRPNLMLPTHQNKYQGYPSYIESALSALQGYTRVSSINLSVPSATGAEIKMIDAILKTGFIVGSGTPLSGSGIVLGANTSPTHQIKKNVSTVATLTGTFRDSVDILHPVVRIERDNPVGFNYVYISDFGRCYYVDDVTVVRKGVLDLHLSVDVLDTFANEILANTAIIDKQEVSYNLYLNDDSIKMRQDPLITNFEFPNGLFDNNAYEYVLLVAGD